MVPPVVPPLPPVASDATVNVMDPQQTVIGMTELSAFLGVAPRTPHMWYFRGLLPPPDFESINGTRAWKRSTLLKWAARTGRLPAELMPEARKYLPSGSAGPKS